MSALGRVAGAWLRQRSPTRRVTAWALAVAGPALLALVALPLRSSLVLGGFLFSALLLVIASAVLGGPRPALTGVAVRDGILRHDFTLARAASRKQPQEPTPFGVKGFNTERTLSAYSVQAAAERLSRWRWVVRR